MTIAKAAVIGAGNMGAGIAAQMANAGIEVELLDIVPSGAADRDAVARGAIDKMAKTSPAPLMHKSNVRRIRPGNIEDHLPRLSECDFILEAVVEKIEVKSALFKKIDAHRKPGSIVASNTSTIPLADLVDGQSDALKKDFVITHFFNPPRYMPLLELVTSPLNPPETVARLARFMDERLGKTVIPCFDRPGFIGNRIGTFWIQTAINEAVARGLTVEEADALMGRPIGAPKTGVFGLVDLVGLDLMPHISQSLIAKLPPDDGYVRGHRAHPTIDAMIAAGYTGRKGKGGFYRLSPNKDKLAVDLTTGAERPAQRPKLAAVAAAKKSLRALVETPDAYGAYAWTVLKKTLCYAAQHAHDITGNITGVDQAMTLGYNWTWGPFELIDKLGVDYFIQRLKAEGEPVPPLLEQAAGRSFYRVENGQLQFLSRAGGYENVVRPEGVLLLADIKRRSKPVADNTRRIPFFGTMGAALWDIGDGVLCLEFTSKGNTLDLFNLKMIHRACDLIEKDKAYRALVIHNAGADFSLGANIGVALLAARLKQHWIIGKMVTRGQAALKRLKYAPFPVVSAPSGKALGGGCEVLMHSHHVQAHAETYMGLVEVGVGLLPAWGGSTELLTRAFANKKIPRGPMPAVAAVFETISTAKVALSAFEAKDLMYLRASDAVTMNKARVLFDAKTKALDMLGAVAPEAPISLELPGPAGLAALNLAVDGFYLKGAATPYDVVVSNRVARVLTGGAAAGPGVKLTQDYIRRLEYLNFMALARDARTLARISSIIRSGKPLREKPEAGLRAADLLVQAGEVAGPVNDNGGLARDGKAKMNWPRL